MSEHVDFVVIGLGALGSATCMELARSGHEVVGLERFGLGHSWGASHDTSRILRHSYHTPDYVRLTQEAYADWARLEHDAGTSLVSVVGGLDLFPPEPAISPVDYTESLDEVGISYDLLDAASVMSQWPQFRLPDGLMAIHQADAAIVPAARGTRVMQDQARKHGADLRELTPVVAVRDLGSSGVEVETAHGVIRCGGLVVCADAWVNDVLGGLGQHIPLEVTLEQVTYFAPPDPAGFAQGQLPLWIWMDDPSYYGFPSYGEPSIKAAQDCGGPVIDPDRRGSEVDEPMQSRLAEHMRQILPGSGGPVLSLRCQYALTPDRDFVISAVPGLDSVVVGMGAAHGFKFAPTFGRLLADLVVEGSTTTDLTRFRMDRPALTDPAYRAHWLV
jgi:sarcosine oxidase